MLQEFNKSVVAEPPHQSRLLQHERRILLPHNMDGWHFQSHGGELWVEDPRDPRSVTLLKRPGVWWGWKKPTLDAGLHGIRQWLKQRPPLGPQNVKVRLGETGESAELFSGQSLDGILAEGVAGRKGHHGREENGELERWRSVGMVDLVLEKVGQGQGSALAEPENPIKGTFFFDHIGYELVAFLDVGGGEAGVVAVEWTLNESAHACFFSEIVIILILFSLARSLLLKGNSENDVYLALYCTRFPHQGGRIPTSGQLATRQSRAGLQGPPPMSHSRANRGSSSLTLLANTIFFCIFKNRHGVWVD